MGESREKYIQELKSWNQILKENVNEMELPKRTLEKWEQWNDMFRRVAIPEISDRELLSIHHHGEDLIQTLRAIDDDRVDLKTYGNHVLPRLPYAYDALEPYIAEEIMRLHHLVHHQAYVDGLNKAEVEIYEKDHDPNLLRHWLREQAFNGSGHILHSIFWENMTPEQQLVPVGQLAQQINKDFGSFQHFKDKFTAVAESVQGPGWALLLFDKTNRRLLIESIEKHQMNQLVDMIPLLVLDVWEHAYYLQYKTDKTDYIEAWWNIVNWENVNERYVKANMSMK